MIPNVINIISLTHICANIHVKVVVDAFVRGVVVEHADCHHQKSNRINESSLLRTSFVFVVRRWPPVAVVITAAAGEEVRTSSTVYRAKSPNRRSKVISFNLNRSVFLNLIDKQPFGEGS